MIEYGVKYRLEFSDVLGFGKKVEILKRNYIGDVLPMIGTEEPVVIKWNSSDDFYSPIIGSTCKLNLMVTEDVQYDDFYKFDEFEYRIKVSYSKQKSQTYIDRIVTDSGIYESIECVNSFLGDFYTLVTYFEKRVIEDGGRIESLNCVAEGIIDERFNIWEDYWVGNIVVDRFKESMVDFPFQISLNAFDGLGLLDKYTAPLSADDDNESENTTSDLERISKILQNIPLYLDIIFINDLNYLDTDLSVKKFPNVTTFPNYLFELKNGFNEYNAKEQLSLLLTAYNMRIFQSFGKWFIVENSNVFDEFVKNYIANQNEFSTPPLNIRELITNRLKSINNEFLTIEKYDYLGENQSNEFINTLKIAPTDLIPVSNNLQREYLQPLLEVEQKLSTNQFEKVYWNNNAGFEYGDFNWNINGTNSEIAENEISKQGSFSMKLNLFAPTFDVKCFTTNKIPYVNGFGFLSDTINRLALQGTKFTFSYFVEANDILLNTRVQFVVKYYDDSTTIYWDNGLNSWSGAVVINTISVNNFNSWQTINKTLKDPTPLDPFNGKLDLEIWSTRTDTTSEYVTTYFDNVGIYQDGAEFFDFIWIEGIETIISGEKSIKAIRSDELIYSSKKSYSSILFPTETPLGVKKWYRTRDFKFIGNTDTVYNNISNIKNQNIMNDFRDYCTRYSGSFRGAGPTPLSLHNKIWFNWLNVLEDEQSSVIDGLSYAVKSNKYDVVAHVPNDDNDLYISIKIT